MYDVACLGILVADTIVKSVDELPERGKLLPVEQISLHSGGCAATAAINLAKIGMKSAIIGKVGKDGFGNFLKESLEGAGVCTQGLVARDGISTSSSVVLCAGNGERTFLHCVGANADFSCEDVNFDMVAESKILFVAGTNLMPQFDGKPCSQVLKRARELGVYTAMDTAWDTSGRWMELVEDGLAHLDLFMPSYEEARMIAGRNDPEEIADVFLARGVGLAVVKLGKDGCFLKDRSGEKYLIPTYSQIKPVDTTGAGDSFAAGFLTGLTMGWDLYRCGRFANAVGTHCVMAVGASTGIRKLDEILDFMKAR